MASVARQVIPLIAVITFVKLVMCAQMMVAVAQKITLLVARTDVVGRTLSVVRVAAVPKIIENVRNAGSCL